MREWRPDRPTLLWWSGLGLLGAFALVGVWAMLFFATDCDVDCGDSGGRGMFALVVASTPLAAVGAMLMWLAPRAGTPGGAPRALRRTLLAALGVGLCVVAIGLGLLAVAAFVAAFDEFNGWLTGRGLSGPLNDPDYMRDQARGAGFFMSAVGLVCAALAAIAIAPVGVLMRGRAAPGVVRPALLGLGSLAVATTVLAAVGLAAILVADSGSLGLGEILLSLGLPLLPAALAAGAFLAASEVRRHA